MHIAHEHDDPRPAQRARVCRELDRLIADLRRDNGDHLVAHALIAAARKLHQHLEDADREPKRRAAMARLHPLGENAP